MIVASALLVYAVVLAIVVPRFLARSTLAERSPAVALVLWQGAAVALLASLMLAGISLAVPSITFSGGIAELLNACAMAIRAQYATPGGAAVGITGLILAGSITVRAAVVLTTRAISSHFARVAHRQGLTLVGHVDIALGITVVDHDRAAAYCVPGRSHRIVLTSAAVDALDADQLRGVLAHERSHLRGRHHLALGFANAMAAAFPPVPLFRVGAIESARIVELLADDAAESACGREVLATALATLATASTPTAALAANGAHVLSRVQRMLRPARPLSTVTAALLVAAGMLIGVTPLAVAVAPAVAVSQENLCPLPSPTRPAADLSMTPMPH